MGSFTIRHTLPLDVDTFWNKVFFDEEFNRRLYLDKLRFRRFERQSFEEGQDGSRQQTLLTEPRVSMPGPIQKIVGESFYYLETGHFDPQSKRYKLNIEAPSFKDRFRLEGELWVEPKGDKSVERIFAVDCQVKIFGVGGMIESFVEKTTRESHDLAVEFTKAYAAEKGLSS